MSLTEIKIPQLNPFKCQALLQYFRIEKCARWYRPFLHKRKDGGAQWLYRYTIRERRREIELGF